MWDGKVLKIFQVLLDMIKKVFLYYVELGELVIYIVFLLGFFGIYQMVVMVVNEIKEEFFDFDLWIVDFKCVFLGCGFVVMYVQIFCVNGNII